MAARRIIIGDVHGHYAGLMQLLDEIAPATDDAVYFLGDLIDRGPQSCQVIDFVRYSPYHCLLGNHEQMMLGSFKNGRVYEPCMDAWLQSGGHATISSYPNAFIPWDHLDWLKTLPTSFDLGDLWLVHAGVNPRLRPEQQTAQDTCWIRDEFHRHPRPYFADKLIITGHTITFTLPDVQPGQLAQGPGWLGIDTGVYSVRSGWLTGVDIDNQLVYQVNIWTSNLRVRSLKDAVQSIDPTRVKPRQATPLRRSLLGKRKGNNAALKRCASA
jgi:serine/threonine protein phosphatase 1